jgi:DNA mismatch repair protein MutS2
MAGISKSTLKDLEFNQVLNRISDFSFSELGKEAIRNIVPFTDFSELKIELKRNDEYLSSFNNENRIPNHSFEDITREIKLLAIENTFLEEDAYISLAAISETVNQLVKFFEKFEEYYPLLKEKTDEEVYFTKDINDAIYTVFNRQGDLKDNATKHLNLLRKKKSEIKREIDQSFQKALGHYSKMGILDEIRESIVENKRVLAVIAGERKKVRGSILGSSKTGSIVFMEPENTQQLHRNLSTIEFEEREEIIRILKLLTDLLRPHRELFTKYIDYLSYLDVLRAKVMYAKELNSCLPKINDEQTLVLKDAFHPILLENNNREKQKTVPQTFKLDAEQRIIVISGPNAGGKSITLKTLGLNQLMIQSGILIPVHESSSVCFFKNILSDIGDNQSIENHLSTYSYRLKNMRYFLRNIDEKSLFLIDEFGTGSDPELGGALAEVFLEEFYDKGSYGVITTHYTNIKIKVEDLPEAVNANMIFNEKNLEPLFKLNVGQAGSSFTFEVAQKNGIAFSLINRAKKKVSRENVRLDKTIAKLQKERAKLEKINSELHLKEIKANDERKKFEGINEKISQKLEDYQLQFDRQAKSIALGKKIAQLSEAYFRKPSKKILYSEVLKLVEIENSKKRQKAEEGKGKAEEGKGKKKIKRSADSSRTPMKSVPSSEIKGNKKQIDKAVLKEEERLKKIEQEMEKKIAKIREEKADQKKQKEQEKINEAKKRIRSLKIGDRVRISGGMAIGSIDKIEKKKAIINYGSFTTSVSIEELDLVEAFKK